MISNYYLELLYYEFPNIKQFPEVIHGIFTRKGGWSNPPYDSLNITFDIGDSEDNVQKNRALVRSCMNDIELIFANQIHGTDIIIYSKDMPQFKNSNRDGDALVTNIAGKGLVIQTADCQSVMLYDPIEKVVANIHSGWRGSIHNIIGKTIHTMGLNFGVNPKNLFVGIGPSLGPCCAEFIHFRKEIPEIFWGYRVNSNHFDFWQISKHQLICAGVPEENIYCSNICTKCHTDLFFSYRSEKITGRFASVIALAIQD